MGVIIYVFSFFLLGDSQKESATFNYFSTIFLKWSLLLATTPAKGSKDLQGVMSSILVT